MSGNLPARLQQLERHFARRNERDFEHELKLMARSATGDMRAWEEWTAIIVEDQSNEPPAPFFRFLHQGIAVELAHKDRREQSQ